MKTFVHHDGALGDMLLSLPCLQKIKAESCAVHLAGRGDVVRFFKDRGVVDAAASSDGALFASLYSAVDLRLRSFLSGFNRAFVFSTEEHPASAAAIGTVIPDTRTIRTIPPGGSQTHAAQYRLSQFEPNVPVSASYTVLRVLPEEAKAAQSLLVEAGYSPGAGLVAVHPGSGGRPKCWPLDRYFGLIERLRLRGDAFVVLFTGEAEDGEIRQEVSRRARGRKDMLHADGLPLLSAAALLSLCGLYVGNDAGFSHLAGTLGCPTIVLFGPTNPLVWKPLGPRVETVSTGVPGPMARISVDDVMAKIRSIVP